VLHLKDVKKIVISKSKGLTGQNLKKSQIQSQSRFEIESQRSQPNLKAAFEILWD